MKKITIFIGFIICCAFNGPHASFTIFTDYRDIYIGNYFCHRTSVTYGKAGSSGLSPDTLTIIVAKDPLDSILQIAVANNTLKFKLKNSSLYPYPQTDRRGGRFFSTDSIGFNILHGHGGSTNYIGKKK